MSNMRQIKKITGEDSIKITSLLKRQKYDEIITIFHKHGISAKVLIQGLCIIKKIRDKDIKEKGWLYDDLKKIGVTPSLERDDFHVVVQIHNAMRIFVSSKIN